MNSTEVQQDDIKSTRISQFQETIKHVKHVLAPMVEQCDLPYRLLVKKYGCDLCFTQMYHSRVMFEDAGYLDRNFATCEEDYPIIVQLCGNDPEYLKRAANRFEGSCIAVDLNLGCPQGIARKGKYGSYLLPNYDLVEQIAKALGSSEVKVPFTVKIRLLPSLDDTIKLCKMLEREGAQMITVHGRTREQNKDKVGSCNWDAIATIRKNLSIPVFANGGICSLRDVDRCIEETSVSGVMVGEAILENPAFFVNGVRPEDNHLITVDEICYEYLDLEEKYPALGSEIKAHMFKILYRALCFFTDERTQLALMNFNTPDSRKELRSLIASLAEKMHQRGDPWILKDCTSRNDSWYNRHLKKNKHEGEKKEVLEKKAVQ